MIVNDDALDTLFRDARSHKAWTDKPVSDTWLHAVYELAKLAPTAMNAQPMRVIFLHSKEAKEKILPHLDAGNVERTRAAPVCAIIAFDTAKGGDDIVLTRNSTLGGAWLIMAARAVGLDCCPMSGFSNAGVDAAFFAGTTWKSNFLLNIGHGDKDKLRPRGDRLSFDEACQIL